MTHPESESTATIERRLEAVDDALRTGAAGHHDPFVRELQELGLLLQADAAEPDPGFAEALGKRVEEGFPRQPSWRIPSTWNLPSPRRLLPAGAAFLTVLVIGIGLASIDMDRSSDDSGGGDDGGMVAQDGGGGAGGGQDDAGASAAPEAQLAQPDPGAGFAPGRANRKVERSISMTLEAPDEEIPALAQDVTRVTSRHGGYVLSSTLDSDEEGANGFFELRIPAGRLRPALADLAGLATVRSQSQSGQDVTRRHVTIQDRLQSARAERRSLLRRLELAATDEEAEAIRRRLDIVAGEINGLRAILRDLRQRTAYAVVTVDLAGTDESPGGGGASGSLDDALGDAGDLAVGLAGVLIRVGAIAIPLGLIAALAWLATRALRRRRRESVLA
jgi:hypothetical protein